MAKTKENSESVVKRESVATPEDVRRNLRLSVEQKAEIKAEQDELLELSRSRAILSDEERTRARGIELERHYLKTHDKNGRAEALGMLGNYAKAAEVATDKELRRVMRENRDAVKKSDADCECDTYYEADDGTLLPNQHAEFYGYSDKHKQVVPFIRCRVCGDLNARLMTTQLAEQQKMRRQSEKGTEIRSSAFFKKING